MQCNAMQCIVMWYFEKVLPWIRMSRTISSKGKSLFWWKLVNTECFLRLDDDIVEIILRYCWWGVFLPFLILCDKIMNWENTCHWGGSPPTAEFHLLCNLNMKHSKSWKTNHNMRYTGLNAICRNFFTLHHTDVSNGPLFLFDDDLINLTT